MPNFAEKIRRGWRETRGNIAVEVAKWIGGSSVLSAFYNGVSQSVHRVPIDWVFLGGFVLVGICLVAFALYRDGTSPRADRAKVVAP